MPKPPAATTIEETLATEQSEKLQDRLRSQRTWYIRSAIALFAIAGVLASTGLGMITLITIVLGLICLS